MPYVLFLGLHRPLQALAVLEVGDLYHGSQLGNVQLTYVDDVSSEHIHPPNPC